MIILLQDDIVNHENGGVNNSCGFELCGHGCDVNIACVLFIVVGLLAK